MDLSRMTDQQRELYNYRIQELLNRRRQQISSFHVDSCSLVDYTGEVECMCSIPPTSNTSFNNATV
ncbi:hypothetical protein LguiB_002285 [Lonicera macranthoides]